MYRVLSKRRSKSKLVEGQAFSPGLQDPCPSSLCEPQSRHLDGWNFMYPLIVGYRADNNRNVIFLTQGIISSKTKLCY